jgi:hypothetical protein
VSHDNNIHDYVHQYGQATWVVLKCIDQIDEVPKRTIVFLAKVFDNAADELVIEDNHLQFRKVGSPCLLLVDQIDKK